MVYQNQDRSTYKFHLETMVAQHIRLVKVAPLYKDQSCQGILILKQ